MILSAQAQKVLETYDVKTDKQTKTIIKDKKTTDKDVLAELDLDDYAVGQEVYITAEMLNKAKIKTDSKKATKPVSQKKAVTQKTKKTASRSTTSKSKKKASSAKRKKVKKKTKRYRSKRKGHRKGRRSARKTGRMACYRF